MKLILFVLFSGLICITACRSAQEKRADMMCEERIRFVKENMYLKDSLARIYYFRDLPKLNYFLIVGNSFWPKDCFYRWRKSEVLELLGRPSADFNRLNDKNVWWYYVLAEGCGSAGKECFYWEFRFDEKDRVRNVRELTHNKQYEDNY